MQLQEGPDNPIIRHLPGIYVAFCDGPHPPLTQDTRRFGKGGGFSPSSRCLIAFVRASPLLSLCVCSVLSPRRTLIRLVLVGGSVVVVGEEEVALVCTASAHGEKMAGTGFMWEKMRAEM